MAEDLLGEERMKGKKVVFLHFEMPDVAARCRRGIGSRGAVQWAERDCYKRLKWKLKRLVFSVERSC